MRNDSTTMTKRLGKNLVNLRASKNQSQQQFADRLGISRGYLSDLERGVREASLETLATICKAARTTPNQLLGF